MTNTRLPKPHAVFHTGPPALVQGLLTWQPLRFAGIGQLDPTQEIELGGVEQRNYSYAPAGRRTGVSGAENATYGYDWRNLPTRTSDEVSSTRVTYDGLGRPVSRETETAYSSEAVTSSFFGGAQLGQVSTLHGASSSVWGVFGQLAGIDSEVTGEARWALLDRLGSVVAEVGDIADVTGADIRELASYAEFGLPSYETGGFTSPYGYTGELQDAGTGIVAFGSRSYDAGSGTWMAPDAWPGLLVAPQSLNRYAYVLGDPMTLIDVGGFAATLPNASGAANHYDYSKGAWKPILNPRPKTYDDFMDRSGAIRIGGIAGGSTSKSPASKTGTIPDRHDTATRKVTGNQASAKNEFQKFAASEAGRNTSAVLGLAAVALGVIALSVAAGPILLLAVVVGVAVGAAATAIECANGITANCVITGVATVAGPFGRPIAGAATATTTWARSGGIVTGVVTTHVSAAANLGAWGEIVREELQGRKL